MYPTPRETLDVFVECALTRQTKICLGLCTKTGWAADRDNGRKLYLQLSRKKVVIVSEDPGLDVIEGKRAACRFTVEKGEEQQRQLWALLDQGEQGWFLSGIQPDPAVAQLFLWGELPANPEWSDLPADDDVVAWSREYVGRIRAGERADDILPILERHHVRYELGLPVVGVGLPAAGRSAAAIPLARPLPDGTLVRWLIAERVRDGFRPLTQVNPPSIHDLLMDSDLNPAGPKQRLAPADAEKLRAGIERLRAFSEAASLDDGEEALENTIGEWLEHMRSAGPHGERAALALAESMAVEGITEETVVDEAFMANHGGYLLKAVMAASQQPRAIQSIREE